MQHSITPFNDFIKITNIPNTTAEPKIYIHSQFQPRILKNYALINGLLEASQVPGTIDVIGLHNIHGNVDNMLGTVVSRSILTCRGIGPAINCGIRLFSLNIDAEDIKNYDEVADQIISEIDFGRCGKGVAVPFKNFDSILNDGILALKKFGISDDDTDCIESFGTYNGNANLLSQKHKAFGFKNFGDFYGPSQQIEVLKVSQIYDTKTAYNFGVVKLGQILVSIHAGCRGLGELLEKGCKKSNPNEYFLKMQCANNYSVANRSIIQKRICDVFLRHFPALKIKLIYDVGHNTLKKEVVPSEGEIYISRRGVSCAYNRDLPSKFLDGQPVPVIGSLGTNSFLVKGLRESLKICLGSLCINGGRIYEKYDCKSRWTRDKIIAELPNIVLRWNSKRSILENNKFAFRDSEFAVNHSVEMGICEKVCKLEPLIHVKR